MEVGSITMHDPDVMTMFVTDSMMLLVWLSYKICLKENANHQLVKISASTTRSGESKTSKWRSTKIYTRGFIRPVTAV